MDTPKSVSFKRTDITTVSSTNRGCIRLLPQGKKATKQRLVVGDTNGVLSSFSVGKALDVKSEFTNEATARPISRVTLHEDQIFVANGASVSAHTKKGKQFFVLETTMSEEIKLLCVRSPFLYIGGGYMLTAFQESAEKGFYMAPDKMNDAALDPMFNESTEASSAGVFVGCQDRTIRRVHHGAVTAEVSCEAPVSAISFEGAAGSKKKERNIHYGTLAGTISCVKKTSETKLENTWSHMPQERSASVSAVMSCNLSQSGIPDIAVAREDGSVEVFQLQQQQPGQENDNNNNNLPLAPILTTSMGEYVSGMDCGFVTYGDHEDVVVSTFSGKIVSLGVPMASDFVVPQTSNGAGGSNVQEIKKVNPDTLNDDAHTLPQANQLKIEETQNAIANLQEKLHDTKVALAKIQAMHTSRKTAKHAEAPPTGSISATSKVDGAMANFGIVDRFSLDEASGDLVITTELDVALGSVCVSSDVALDIVEEGQSDSCSSWDPNIIINGNSTTKSSGGEDGAAGAAMMMMSSGENTNTNKPKFLGVFRCGSADASGMPKRLEIRFRCDEGNHGVLTSTIHTFDKAHGAVPKTYNIPPLSRHVRLAPADVPTEQPLSTSPQFAKLYITGAFSIQEAHRWLHACLMDVPEKVAATSESSPSVTYHFRNMYIGTLLECTVAKGELVAYSQNAMTLTILRDHITRQATQRKIAVRIESDIKPEAVDVVIWLGIEIWRGLRSSAQQYELIDALKELESQEQDLNSFLSPNLRDILSRQKELQRDAKNHEKNLAELKDFLKRWIADAVVFCQSSEATQIEQVVQNFSRLLDAPVTEQTETDLRMFCRDACFPNGGPLSQTGASGEPVPKEDDFYAENAVFSNNNNNEQNQQEQQGQKNEFDDDEDDQEFKL